MAHNLADSKSYNRDILVSTTPSAAFRALTREIGKWWTPPEGNAASVGDTPIFRFGETFWKMRVVELVPDKLIVWECYEANHVDKRLSDRTRHEWEGTILRWEIEKDANGTKIRFVHNGLVPTIECYTVCEGGWDHFFVSQLHRYLNSMST